MLDENVFVEQVLPAGTVRTLTDDERDAYRAPYREPGERRRPTLTWPREIPIDGVPADVAGIVAANAVDGRLPRAEAVRERRPGALLTGAARELCRSWPAQTEVTVPGLHFLPEDSAPQIADALDTWLGGLSETRRTPADGERTGAHRAHLIADCGHVGRRSLASAGVHGRPHSPERPRTTIGYRERP